MPKDFNPYLSYTAQWLQMLDKCRSKKDPGIWLYKNNARVTLFMLQSITRIWFKAFQDKNSGKWRKTFKKLEDMLGQVDHYDVLVNEFSKIKTIPASRIDYLEKKKEKALKKLNKNLREKNFYQKFMITFNRASTVNFNKKELLLELEKQVKIELFESNRFFNEYPQGFNDMELQVHNLRRKLRWISIYGQSLQGIIRLQKTNKSYKWEKEFITESVLSSPFNKLPVKRGLKYSICLNQKAFYALSYVIGELGAIKDKGLAIEALAKAIQKTKGRSVDDPVLLATQELRAAHSVEDLLQEAHVLLTKFFNTYKIHQALTRV